MDGRPPEKVLLYDGVCADWFQTCEVQKFLESYLPGVPVEIRRSDLLAERYFAERPDKHNLSDWLQKLAEMLCRIRVRDPWKREFARRLLRPEIDYEIRVLSGKVRPSAGVIYDGHELQALAFNALQFSERRLTTLVIWFTDRTFATWDDTDCRYHIRISVLAYPSIVSTSGMVRGPARDAQYYIARHLGSPSQQLTNANDRASGWLEDEDPRSTEVAKGVAMQAVFYAAMGEPFCPDPKCRLFNAHWQRQMLDAQTVPPDFCRRHMQKLKEWAKSTT